MSAAERFAKRQRVGRLRASLPFISQDALAAVSAENQRGALPRCSRAEIRQARDEEVRTDTPYGTLHTVLEVPCADSDAPLKIEIQNPFSMFWYAITISRAFSTLVKAALEHCPCTFSNPWNMIVYNDEISPGNQLAFKNARKLQGLYWSILELGGYALSNEDCWFELSFLRSRTTKRIRAGISGLFVCLIQFMFCVTGGHNFQTSGVHVNFHDGSTATVFLKYGITLADEGALHMIFESKGSTGLKCCALCSNVYDAHNFRGIVESDRPGGPVLHTCSRASALTFGTLPLLVAIMTRLAAAATTLGKDIYIYVYIMYI